MKKLKTFFKTPQERKQRRRLMFRLSVAAFIFALIAFFSFFFYARESSRLTIRNVHDLWTAEDYGGAYLMAQAILDARPFNNSALAYRGFSAFYLAVSEPDLSLSQSYLEDAIISLRKALRGHTLSKRPDTRLAPQLAYMLGKAYFYKNTNFSYHYYADLAVRYLLEARELGFAGRDIPEFLGLSYAALGMTSESIMAFSEALLVRDSDVLELAIAEQYYKNEQAALAKPYLFKVANTSLNDALVKQSRILLGSIYLDEAHYADARREYQAILAADPFYADAFYGMGLLYEKTGEYVKARAEWRRALQYDVNNQGALQKLADSR